MKLDEKTCTLQVLIDSEVIRSEVMQPADNEHWTGRQKFMTVHFAFTDEKL